MIHTATQKPLTENPIIPVTLPMYLYAHIYGNYPYAPMKKHTAFCVIILRPGTNPEHLHTLSQKKRHIKHP
jgi:hypothetical protein